jgi:hypothetical protein
MTESTNARKRGNNIFNMRIAELTIKENWNAHKIWRHLITDEKVIYQTFPISMTTVQRRVKQYNDNRKDFERYFYTGMPHDEMKVFLRRMKLGK